MNLNETAIRKAKTEDADSIFILVKDFATSFSPTKDAFSVSYQKLLEDDSAITYVAVLNDQIIGYCLGFTHYTYFANGKVAWLEEIMVQEEFRRNNVGTMLMNAFENWAQEQNNTLIGLATRRASSFYEALDYENSAIYFRKLL